MQSHRPFLSSLWRLVILLIPPRTGCSFRSTVLSVLSQTPVLPNHCFFWSYRLNWKPVGFRFTHFQGTSGFNPGRALEANRECLGSCSFFVLNHPLPYCCFLGRTRRREFLGQLICSCVWSSSRLQAIPASSSVFQDLAHFFFSLQNLPVAGLPSPRPGVICRL